MAPVVLTNDEIEACREAFVKFDRECSGVIDSSELRATLQAMGQKPSEEELFDMIAEIDSDGSGRIGARIVAPLIHVVRTHRPSSHAACVPARLACPLDFPKFLKMMMSQKAQKMAAIDETDTIDAFVVLGGNADKTGVITSDRLRRFVRDFGLSVNVEKLISDAELDKSGFIDYEEFRTMSWA
jgi:calmodulin